MENTVEAQRDRNLLRLYYFMMWGGAAFMWPYISLFYARQNLDGMQVGVLVAIGSGVGLVFAPLWGRWSDRSARPVRLLQFALLGSAILFFIVGMHSTFHWLMLLSFLNGIVTCAVLPLSDSLALNVADSDHYGSVRMWGSLGWAVTVLGAGWLIERTSIRSGFYGYTLLFLLAVLILFLLPKDRMRSDQTDTSVLPGSIKTLLSNRSLLALAGVACVWYFINKGLQSFEPLYLDQVGAGESVLGLLNMLRALVEIPVMLWADKLSRRHSPSLLIILALLIRLAASAAIVMFPTVPVIVTVRAIDGISNAFMFVGIVSFIGRHVPNGQQSFAITVITVSLMNAMSLINGPISGWVFETFGGYWLYVIALAGYVIGLAVFTMIENSQTRCVPLEEPV
jgi:PPP family 3-phenylpropionic acid transporter